MGYGVVLGGGGAVGIAWEIAVLAALEEQGVSVLGASAVVGTSAGSLVGLQAFGGRDLQEMLQEQADTQLPEQMEAHPSAPDVKDLFKHLEGLDPQERGKVLGAEALAMTPTMTSEMHMAMMEYLLKVTEWPKGTRFLPTGTDCETGERFVFDATQGVSVVAAVAASCCVPQLVPVVRINGRAYIDGGVSSPSNMDVLLGLEGIDRVVFIGPFGGPDTPVMPLVTESLETELAAFAEAGIPTFALTPGPRLAAEAGTDFLNPALRPIGVDCGLADGKAAAPALAAFLAG